MPMDKSLALALAVRKKVKHGTLVSKPSEKLTTSIDPLSIVAAIRAKRAPPLELEEEPLEIDDLSDDGLPEELETVPDPRKERIAAIMARLQEE